MINTLTTLYSSLKSYYNNLIIYGHSYSSNKLLILKGVIDIIKELRCYSYVSNKDITDIYSIIEYIVNSSDIFKKEYKPTNNITSYFQDVPSQFYPKGQYNVKVSLVTVLANSTAFKYDGEGNVWPNSINLQAIAYNFTPAINAPRRWEYSNGGEFIVLKDQTSDNLTITPDSELWNNTDMISFRYVLNDIYTNQLTILKVRDGYGAYNVEITSSNGDIFQNNRIDTELTANVFIAGNDISSTIANENFTWKRISDDPVSDSKWNNKNLKGKTIRITNADVTKKAIFICTVIIDDTKILNGQITIIDQLDTTNISATLESNKSLTQLYNTEDGKLNPDWSISPYLVLTPGVWAGSSTDNLLISQSENIKNPKWLKNGLTINNSDTHVIDNQWRLTIKTNELTLNPNIRYTFSGIYIDPLTKAETPFYSSLSFVRVETSGTTIQAIMSYPLGNIFKNDDVIFLKAHCDLWRGSYIDTTDVVYKWFIEKPGVFDPKYTTTSVNIGDNVLTLNNTTGIVRGSDIKLFGVNYKVASVNSEKAVVLASNLQNDIPSNTKIVNPYYDNDGGEGWALIDETNDFNGITGFTTNEITIPEQSVINFATFKCVIKDTDSSSITFNQTVYATASFLDQQDPLQISFDTPEGTIFKNNTGTITIKAEVWRNGIEVDPDGIIYTYDWIQYDKNGNVIPTFSRISKSILITPNNVDQKSNFEVRLKNDNGNTIAKGRITIVDLIDGSNSIAIYTRDMLKPETPQGESPMKWNVNPNAFDDWWGLLWQSFNINSLTGEPSGEWSPPILVDEYTTNMLFRWLWKNGSGDINKYIQYGTNSENERTIEQTPFDMPDTVWKCISSGNGNINGGFNVPNIPIYNDYTYRYSIWVKQMQKDGQIYFGCDENTILADSGEPVDGIFWAGDVPEINKWYLLVGYINGSNINTGNNINGGIYDPKTGRKASNATFRTFKLKTTDEIQKFRAYQAYSLGVGNEIQFWDPRIDICNNQEPSISEILKQTAMGSSAKKVTINGDQIFKYKDDFQGEPIPNVIDLVATTQNIVDPQYIWKCKTADTNWTILDNTTNSLTINPNDPKLGWNTGNTYVTYRVEVEDYYDTHTIVKITDGLNGINGADGVDGTSIIWKGEFASHPENPENGWAYKNTTDGKSYVYQSGSWYQMTVDGIDGKNGKDGLSIEWKGEFYYPPSNPQINWVYRDLDNGKVYIYNGTAWTLMVADGNDGTDGTNGSNGYSVFITYHDAELKPNKPTGNGTTGGWHTDTTDNVIWMSQKVAASASTGEWGDPIKIVGTDGWYTDFKYALSEDMPSIAYPSGKSPGSNWFDNPPQPTGNQFVWMTKILKNPITFEVKEGEQWSTPVKMTGDRGEDSYSVVADSEYHNILVTSGTKNEIDSSYLSAAKSGTTFTVLKGQTALTYLNASVTAPSKGYYSIIVENIDEGLEIDFTDKGVLYPKAFDSSKLILHVTVKIYCEDSGISFIKTITYRKINEENFYVEDALKYTTSIENGLILSTSIRLGHAERIDDFSVTFTDEKAGMYGGSNLPGMGFADKTVRIWSGGTLDSAQLWSNEFEEHKNDANYWRTYTPPGSSFVVRQDGSVLANNGLFLGTVIANDGYFNGTIHSFDGQIGNIKINADGSFGQQNSNFYVDKDGNLTAKNGTFNGEINAVNGSFSGTISVTNGTTIGRLALDNTGIRVTAESPHVGYLSIGEYPDASTGANVSFGIKIVKGNGLSTLQNELFFAGNYHTGSQNIHQVRINGDDLYIRNHLNLGDSFGYTRIGKGVASSFNYQSIFLWTGANNTEEINLNGSRGYEGQIITIVSCDATDDPNLWVKGFYQFTNHNLTTFKSANIEFETGGSSLTIIKMNGKWMYLSRSGNANWK